MPNDRSPLIKELDDLIADEQKKAQEARQNVKALMKARNTLRPKRRSRRKDT